ncbi:pectinesterase inhibitor 10-like [Camellia sinensis]|uniref:Pectinesterase inhibitor domain-containing protein n=1 Tax=Camellia sinensis var. sinensis TaxID=542762 RepID=A0A4S4D268_CAMSN|nr:pectinesterase inhibitor 10-like [Camellia sinensis]THF96350.1 hypothetical protein TEA_012817 [Camellia sinensis var. sinensis]
MDPPTSHELLFFSLFSLLILNSAQAICVPRNSAPTWDLSPSPNYPQPPASTPAPETSQPSVSTPASKEIQSDSISSQGNDASVLSVSNPASQSTLQTTPTPPTKSAMSFLSNMVKSVPLLNQNSDPALKKICDSTDYPDVCLSAVVPKLGGKNDLPSVIEMAIKAASEYTKVAVDTATKLASNPGIPPKMASIINDIRDSYSDALDNYNEAMEALQKHDVGTMNSMLSAAITDFSDCDDDLAGQSSPLLEFNGKLRKMTSNCLAIVSLIQQ